MPDEIKGDVGIKQEPEAKGIKIVQTGGELPPPLKEQQAEQPPPEDEIRPGERKRGKVPLSPAVIKPPLRFEGIALAEATGYPGWMYTEEELEEIAELIRECGWEADPRLQVVLSLVTMHGVRFTSYMVWKRTGRKGDLRKESTTGEVEKTKRPKEEVVL